MDNPFYVYITRDAQVCNLFFIFQWTFKLPLPSNNNITGIALLIQRLAKGDGASFTESVQTGPEAHTSCCTLRTGFFSEAQVSVMQPLNPSIAEVKEGLLLQSYTPSGPVPMST